MASDLVSLIQPYRQRPSRHVDRCGQPAERALHRDGVSGFGPTLVAIPSSTATPVKSCRLVFDHEPSFDPEPFITDPLLKAGSQNPLLLRKPQEFWPRARQARALASRRGPRAASSFLQPLTQKPPIGVDFSQSTRMWTAKS